MKCKETVYLPTFDNNVEINEIELSPYPVHGMLYHIPSSIYSNSFPLKCICMYYKSDEYKVLLTREMEEYPKRLVESSEKAYDDDHDHLLMAMEFQDYNYEHRPMAMKFPISGERTVRISLFKVGESVPLRIMRFRPSGNPEHPWITLGWDSPLESGDYFLLFDNVLVDLEKFSTFKSFVGKKKNIRFDWWGSESYGKPFYLENEMLVLPFRIYPKIE